MKPVNPSTVKHLSPLRYAGGKTWLVPVFRRWLASLGRRPPTLVGAFAGGASCELDALERDLIDRLLLIERDPELANLWKCVFEYGLAFQLAQSVRSFRPDDTDSLWRLLCHDHDRTPLEKALRTVVRNRVNRGGILAPGAGMLKLGDGKGLLSRWYPETIALRLERLHEMRRRVEVWQGDGARLFGLEFREKDYAWFLDPPYGSAGRRLYLCHHVNHEALFRAAGVCRGPLLMTYEDTPATRALADGHGLEAAPVPMKTTHHALKTELLLSRDLSWL